MDTPPHLYAHHRPPYPATTAMSRGPPLPYGHYHHPQQWEQHYSYDPPRQHHPASQPPVPSYQQQHQPYATPSTASPLVEQAHYQHHQRRKRSPEEGSPALSQASISPEVSNSGTDWIFLRQHIMDNGEALMQNPCPTAYGPHDKGRYTVVTLLTQMNPERWRAGLVCDGLLVIEGPENGYKQDAMMTLSEVISTRLAKAIQRAWDVDDAETGVEEHASGARFATESHR